MLISGTTLRLWRGLPVATNRWLGLYDFLTHAHAILQDTLPVSCRIKIQDRVFRGKLTHRSNVLTCLGEMVEPKGKSQWFQIPVVEFSPGKTGLWFRHSEIMSGRHQNITGDAFGDIQL